MPNLGDQTFFSALFFNVYLKYRHSFNILGPYFGLHHSQASVAFISWHVQIFFQQLKAVLKAGRGLLQELSRWRARQMSLP